MGSGVHAEGVVSLWDAVPSGVWLIVLGLWLLALAVLAIAMHGSQAYEDEPEIDLFEEGQ